MPIAPSVKVTDKFGNPVAGASVTFNPVTGGGLANGAAVNTGADGIATVGSWRLGTAAGANTLSAGTGSLTPVTFTATATAGAAAALTLTPTSIPDLTPGQTVQLTAKAVDASGNPIANPGVAFTSNAPGVATVSSTGLVTAVGAGTSTIVASIGSSLAATVGVSVIGHPATTTITHTPGLRDSSNTFGAVPNAIAFSRAGMYVGLAALSQVLILDPTGTTQIASVQLTTPVQFLVAPTKGQGPVLAVNGAALSQLWFLDPITGAVLGQPVVNDIVTSVAMNSTGTRAYLSLADGELSVYDATSYTEITRISLGGGVTQVKVAPGDTLLYATTTVGVLFEVDIRANAVKRQIIANIPSTDFDIGIDGLFYFLDGPGSTVRLYSPVTNSVVRTVGVPALGTTIAVTPDARQIWVTHNNSGGTDLSVFTGNSTSGFLSTAELNIEKQVTPVRVYISPTGSFAAIAMIGGWVDVVR